ncbi:MAG: hypothetical protein C4576_33605 [Desulfobacteraceae bacterium]|nr:MAG: hypothetical protein C4576_33605 [Desulfobacteraceae bacterium]
MNGSFIALTITDIEAKLAWISHQNSALSIRGLWHLRSEQHAGWPVQDRIGRILRGEIPGTRRALLILSSEDVTYRHFSFPFTSSRKALQAIRFEIGDEFPPAQYVVDTIESLSLEPGRKSFISAILKREVLQKRFGELAGLGLSIIGITTDVSTLGAYFNDENDALVMEVGSGNALFILYSRKVPVLVRGIPIGLRDLGGNIQPLVREIKRTVLSFQEKTRTDLRKIYLAGSLVKERDLLGTLNKADNLQFIDQPPSGKEFKTAGSRTDLNAFASLLGATRSKKRNGVFRFDREGLEGARSLASGRARFRWAAVVLICFLFTFSFSHRLKIHALQKREAFLRSESRRVFSAAFPQVNRIVDEVRQARTLMEAKKSESGTTPFSSVSLLEILDRMSRAIPRDISFQIINLFWERGRLEIDGRTDSFKTVNVIQELLSRTPDFPEVNISNARARSEGQDVDFKITIRIAG